MLVLSRKPKESIVINGNVTVSVLRVDNENVRIGIEAPMEVPVMRQEIYNEIRPHFSNHYLTPNQMHEQSELKMKTYKTKNQSKNVFALV